MFDEIQEEIVVEYSGNIAKSYFLFKDNFCKCNKLLDFKTKM
jgi:hypothetical protein